MDAPLHAHHVGLVGAPGVQLRQRDRGGGGCGEPERPLEEGHGLAGLRQRHFGLVGSQGEPTQRRAHGGAPRGWWAGVHGEGIGRHVLVHRPTSEARPLVEQRRIGGADERAEPVDDVLDLLLRAGVGKIGVSLANESCERRAVQWGNLFQQAEDRHRPAAQPATWPGSAPSRAARS